MLVAFLLAGSPASIAQSGPPLFPGPTFPVGNWAVSVAIGDLDGDGALDLATANQASNSVSVLLGNGQGAFGAAVSYAVGQDPRSVAIGDLDRDGALDLVAANVNSDTVSVLLGTGRGTFGAPAS